MNNRNHSGDEQPPEVALPRLQVPAKLRLSPSRAPMKEQTDQAETSRSDRKPSIGGAKTYIVSGRKPVDSDLTIKPLAGCGDLQACLWSGEEADSHQFTGMLIIIQK